MADAPRPRPVRQLRLAREHRRHCMRPCRRLGAGAVLLIEPAAVKQVDELSELRVTVTAIGQAIHLP
jgi:hypothetical protein